MALRAVSLLLDVGLDRIEAHDQDLVQQLIDGLPARWRLRSSTAPGACSTLVLIEGADPDATADAARRLHDRGIDVAGRAGGLRLSPHLHNDHDDIDRALAALASR